MFITGLVWDAKQVKLLMCGYSLCVVYSCGNYKAILCCVTIFTTLSPRADVIYPKEQVVFTATTLKISLCFLASTLKHGGWYLPKLYFYRSKCSKKNLKILNGKCGVAFCSFKVHRLQRILDFKFLQCNCMIRP